MKISQALALTREAQVLRVFSLITHGGLTRAAACREVGISPRTYERWAGASLGSLQEALREQRAMIAGQILAAQADYVSRLIKTATSDEEVYDSVDAGGRQVKVRQPIYTRDRVLVVQELEKILAGMPAEAPAGEGEAARFLASRPQWLSGPTTMTVRMVDGTEVEIAGGERPVIEAEARVGGGAPAGVFGGGYRDFRCGSMKRQPRLAAAERGR